MSEQTFYCLCGGELVTRRVDWDDGHMWREYYCLKCGKINDRQFNGYRDETNLTHDCIKTNPDCPYHFDGKCGGRPTYPPDYKYPKYKFICVLNIPREPRQLKMSVLR